MVSRLGSCLESSLLGLEAIKARITQMDLEACTQRLAELNGCWPERPTTLQAAHPEFLIYHRAASLHAQEKELLRARIVGFENPVIFGKISTRPFVSLRTPCLRLRQ